MQQVEFVKIPHKGYVMDVAVEEHIVNHCLPDDHWESYLRFKYTCELTGGKLRLTRGNKVDGDLIGEIDSEYFAKTIPEIYSGDAEEAKQRFWLAGIKHEEWLGDRKW